MIQLLAVRLTEYSVERRWIENSSFEWCKYAIEKWIGRLIFTILTVLVMVMTHSFVKLLSFISVFALFRQRQGGWHAKHFWSCQVISIGMMMLVALAPNTIFEYISSNVWIAVSMLTTLCTFALKPVYPQCVHFSAEEKTANVMRRNYLLGGLFILQCVCYFSTNLQILVCSILGLAIADVSVLLEYLCIKLRKD